MPGNIHAVSGQEPLNDDITYRCGSTPVDDDPGKKDFPPNGVAFESSSSDTDSNAATANVKQTFGCLATFYERLFPSGTIFASCYSLASATLGGGIVSVSSGFHDSGIIVSTVLLLVVAACTVYSIRLLALAKDKTGLRSYEEMARGLLGRGWDYFAAFLMFMFCWGVCVGYVISVGDMLEAFFKKPSTPEFLLTGNGKRLMTALIWLVGMFTLSLPKQINSLRYVSFVACMMICFFVVCVIAHAARNGMKGGLRKDLKLASSGMDAVNGLSLFIFAFLNQVNVFEIYEEMKRPTPRNLTIVASITMTVIMLLNFFSGLFGYMDFGEGVTGSLLLMYAPHKNVEIFVSYIGICIKLCVGFAICIQPSRDAVYYCLGWGKTSDVKYWVNWLVSGFLALAALICGLFIPNINIVFSLLGGICGGFLGFMFPAYFYMYSGDFTLKNVGIWNYLGCIVLIVGGVVAVVFGTAAAIYSEI